MRTSRRGSVDPERSGERREEGLDREGRADEADLLLQQRQDRHPLMERDGERDEDEVDRDEHRAAEQRLDGDRHRVGAHRMAEEEDRDRRGERRQRVDRGVERGALEGLALCDLGDERADRGHEDGLLPAEEDDRGEDEDEREGDGAEIVLLEGDRLELREESEREEQEHGEPLRHARRVQPEAHRRPDHDRSRERDGARDQDA